MKNPTNVLFSDKFVFNLVVFQNKLTCDSKIKYTRGKTFLESTKIIFETNFLVDEVRTEVNSLI